jgi:hypothetical protein
MTASFRPEMGSNVRSTFRECTVNYGRPALAEISARAARENKKTSSAHPSTRNSRGGHLKDRWHYKIAENPRRASDVGHRSPVNVMTKERCPAG